MQEIELKFTIEDINLVKEQLEKMGCQFSDLLNQKDTIFIPDIKDSTNGEGKIFVRIRSVNEKNQVTLKKQGVKLSESKEIEFDVSDYDDVYEFLTTLGLAQWVTVEKKRITTKYKEFNICLDEVKYLGSFIEIEILTDELNKVDYYEEMMKSVADELGIDIKNIVNKHYDTMISELINNA